MVKRAKRKEKAVILQEPESKGNGFFGFQLSSTALVILAIVVIFLAFTAYVLMQPPPPAYTTSYQEPLVPAVGLKLLPGEKYVYRLGDGQNQMLIEHNVQGRSEGCMVVTTSFENYSIPFCIDEATGEAKLSGQTGENAQAAGPDFAQSWMLALKDGWNWTMSVNTTVEMMGSTETIQALSVYRVASRGTVKGRDAFKVIADTSIRRVSNGRIYSSDNTTETVWVDVDKRVLLYTSSNGVTVELVEAPFKITNYSG
jgi:hypothetical protein